MRRRSVLTWSVSALAAGLATAQAPAFAETPAGSLKSMFDELNRCLVSVRLVPGTDVTVQFSLNRRGGLIGKPRMTHAHWEGDENDRREAAASIADGFHHCLPVAISDSLGGAIAGRLIAYRIRGRPPDAKT
jgi:hypothetical protein